jgi:hypothetical protein
MIKHPQDLHALFFSHTKLPDIGPRIYLQSIFLTQTFNICYDLLRFQQKTAFALAQNDILSYRKRFDQFKMLMYHPDTAGNGVSRRSKLYFLPANHDTAFCRLVKTCKDTHQSTFTAAVFTQERMYLTGIQFQIYFIVGDNAGKPFRYLPHTDKRQGHDFAPFIIKLIRSSA